jgi:acetylcholinesterase
MQRAAPVSQWDGVLNATRFREPCVQYNLLIDAIEGEEDCLYLNVFTPKLAKDGGDKKYPVIVFIHQGELIV